MNLDDPLYAQTNQGPDAIPWGSGVETCQLENVVEHLDGRKSKHLVKITFTVLETDRPDAVSVGRKYCAMINLDRPGSYREKGTPAYFAMLELTQFVAGTMGITVQDATVQKKSLSKEYRRMLDAGESLAEEGLTFQLKSKDRVVQKDGIAVMKVDGQPLVMTNRYYGPSA